MIDIIFGGNKSGKSDFALQLLAQSPEPWTFIATGKAKDLAFRDQIMVHRQSRNRKIKVWEIETELPAALTKVAQEPGSVVVDSLDFWLFSLGQNFPLAQERQRIIEEFLQVLTSWSTGPLILVSAEMSLGPLALDGSLRAFVRDLGALNAEIARLGTRVYLILAGLPQQLK